MVFFFQAEDGIRDDLVTGVQTCALPISLSCAGVAARLRSTLMFRIFACGATPISRPPPISPAASEDVQEIGRASCRERACTSALAPALNHHPKLQPTPPRPDPPTHTPPA